MGGSLQMWKNYFSVSGNNVQIYVIDIDPEYKALEDGFRIFIGFHENKAFLQKVKSEIGEIDILIDDEGNRVTQQTTAFEELFDLINEAGIFLCEDLHTSYMRGYDSEYKGNTLIEYSKI